jgi:hypothetical protein
MPRSGRNNAITVDGKQGIHSSTGVAGVGYGLVGRGSVANLNASIKPILGMVNVRFLILGDRPQLLTQLLIVLTLQLSQTRSLYPPKSIVFPPPVRGVRFGVPS